jgi:hypothetical protein
VEVKVTRTVLAGIVEVTVTSEVVPDCVIVSENH